MDKSVPTSCADSTALDHGSRTAVPKTGADADVWQNGCLKVFRIALALPLIAVAACRRCSSISALYRTGTETDLQQDGELKLRFQQISALFPYTSLFPSSRCNAHCFMHPFRAKQVFRPRKSGYEEGVITKRWTSPYQQVAQIRQLSTTVAGQQFPKLEQTPTCGRTDA